MSIRSAIQKHSALTVVVCCGLTMAAMLAIMAGTGRPQASLPPRTAWFFDLSTGLLFMADRDTVSPLAIDGSIAVRARVYGCNGCGEEDRHVVAIEKYPDDVAAVLRQPLPPAALEENGHAELNRRERLMAESLLIALPPQTTGDEVRWIPATAPQAREIAAQIQNLCGGAEPQPCEPISD